MRSGFYVITGEPKSYITFKDRSSREWTPNKESYRHAQISLESQHQGPLFGGPLEVHINFFFKFPSHELKKRRVGPFHSTSPSLLYLYRFIEEACRGIVVERFNSIVDLHMFKIYADDPRTEIIIKERKPNE